jgi:hypothetical protein
MRLPFLPKVLMIKVLMIASLLGIARAAAGGGGSRRMQRALCLNWRAEAGTGTARWSRRRLAARGTTDEGGAEAPRERLRLTRAVPGPSRCCVCLPHGWQFGQQRTGTGEGKCRHHTGACGCLVANPGAKQSKDKHTRQPQPPYPQLGASMSEARSPLAGGHLVLDPPPAPST